MFEKEAEEIAKDIYIHHFDDDVKYPDVLKAITVGVQKGAEFGYNKAKEEHKQDELGLIISNSSARAEIENQLAQAKEILKRFVKWFDYISESENWKTIVADARKLLEDK